MTWRIRHRFEDRKADMIMNANASASADVRLSFINSQLQGTRKPGMLAEKSVRRAVTISRQTASGAVTIAEKLAQYLQHHSSGGCLSVDGVRPQPDRQGAGRHNLPTRLAKFLPEDRVSQIEDILADVFQVHPPAETILQQTTETILKLAGLGNVILIGRAAR